MSPRLSLSVSGPERLFSNRKSFSSGIFLLYFFFFLVVSCATTAPFSNKALLDFLEDGKTPKEQVFLKLGQPNKGTFNGERIITYKMGGDKDAKGSLYWIVQPVGLIPNTAWFSSLMRISYCTSTRWFRCVESIAKEHERKFMAGAARFFSPPGL